MFLLLFASPVGVAHTSSGSDAARKSQQGTASWHVGKGDRTASGERWQAEDFMAAHRSLPLGSKVRVANVRNGRSTVVRITDRGPYTRGRIIDLSRAAARELGLLSSGVGQVTIEVLPPGV